MRPIHVYMGTACLLGALACAEESKDSTNGPDAGGPDSSAATSNQRDAAPGPSDARDATPPRPRASDASPPGTMDEVDAAPSGAPSASANAADAATPTPVDAAATTPPVSSALPDSATPELPDAGSGDAQAPEEAADPAEIAIGERLFLETRFAEYFYSHMTDINAPLAVGDPALDVTQTLDTGLAGPFAGQSMNCSACHLVDQQLEASSGGMRTYADFSRRSPIPDRGDGLSFTPRNSPPLVNAAHLRSVPTVFHFDGEFPDMVTLVEGTLTGRNYGWLATEGALARAHIAQVLQEDDGSSDLAAEFGALPYSVLLTGTDPSIPPELVLPEEYRVDAVSASNEQLLEAVKRLIAVYVDHLAFSKDEQGNYNLSPYDAFLAKNSLPTGPNPGESDGDYTQRLSAAVAALEAPLFVTPADGSFQYHDQSFQFGLTELEGLKIFLASPAGDIPSGDEIAAGGIGNCAACHAAPNFTDFRFHNTGVTQQEYDAIHTYGAFVALDIPDLATRDANYDAYMPPTPNHPAASGVFRGIPAADAPGRVDLGAWNIVLNPEYLGLAGWLETLICADTTDCSSLELLLDHSVATFKTSGLRDLGHSAPYLHNGQFDELEDVLDFYQDVSAMVRASSIRNPDPEIGRIALVDGDAAPLAAFLRALNEDYE